MKDLYKEGILSPDAFQSIYAEAQFLAYVKKRIERNRIYSVSSIERFVDQF